MSTYWHIQCVDCDDRLHFDNANHAEDAMWAIIKAAPLLTSLPDGFYLTYDGLYQGHIDISWLAAHKGHKLIPIDEYGRLATQCQDYWTCSECAARHNCKKPLGHEGEHGK